MANNPLQTAHVGEEDHHRFRHGSRVPRYIAFYTHHTTSGSSQAVWEGFILMKRLAAEMRDFRLQHKGTVHQHLSEIYKNHDYIMECIQAASLRDKPSFVTQKEWERERKSKIRENASQSFRAQYPQAPMLQHSFELAQSYDGNTF